VNDSGPQGHTINDAVIASLRRDVPWLLAGDPAWRAVIADMPEADAGDAATRR
jgi:hypothetical protein